MLTAISTAYGKLISNYTTNSSTIQYFEPPRSIFLEAHFILLSSKTGNSIVNEFAFSQIICILAFLVAALLLVDSSKKIFDGFSMKTLVFLILNLISNGMVMFSQKLFGMCRPEGNVALFSFLTFLIPTVFMAIILPFTYKFVLKFLNNKAYRLNFL